jgi:hypothetical protein
MPRCFQPKTDWKVYLLLKKGDNQFTWGNDSSEEIYEVDIGLKF